MSAVPQEAAGSATTHRLYEQYGRQIYAYCLQRLRSREEAEDAVQTTFLNAFRALQRGTVTEFQQAWLYKIAQNVCLERREASGKRAQLESPSDLHLLQETAPAHAPLDSEQLIGVEAALQRIPANQRKAILLREWHGLSYREIGAELGLAQPAVETLIFRARRSLASALEQPAEAQTKKQRRAYGGRALNVGSIVTALKTLFTGGATVKMVAVAVTAGAAAVTLVAPPKHVVARHLHPRAEAPVTPAPSAPVAQPASVMPHPATAVIRRVTARHVVHHARVVHPHLASAPRAVTPTRARATQKHATPSDVEPSAPATPAPVPAPAPPTVQVAPTPAPAATGGGGGKSPSQQPLPEDQTPPPPAPNDGGAVPPPPPPSPDPQPQPQPQPQSPGNGSGSGNSGQAQGHAYGQGQGGGNGNDTGGGQGTGQDHGQGNGNGGGEGQGQGGGQGHGQGH